MSARRADEWRWVGPDGFEYSGSREKLCEALSTGRLAPSTPVWRAGFEIWLPAEQVPELAEEIVGGSLPAYALETGPFAPSPALKTPPPVGISADAVVVAAPGAQMKVVAPPQAPAQGYAQPAQRSKKGPILLAAVLLPALGGALVLGLLWGLGVFAGSQAKQAASSAPAPVAAPSASAQVSNAPKCSVAQTKRVARVVHGKVPIVVSTVQGMLGLGFAETRMLARAAAINPETLKVERQKGANSVAPIVASAAFERDGQLELIVDVDDPRLRVARTFAPATSLKIGSAPGGIATIGPDGRLETLWKSDANAELTVPRVDGSTALGYFVALRRGGLGGKLLGGWFGADSKPRSELATIALESAQVGTPTVAVGDSGVLMAVAARPNERTPWEVMLGTAPAGKSPERLMPLAAPKSSDGAQRMSPAGASRPDGRWALQYTERTDKGHVVRVVLLDSKLQPLSEPLTVSPEGSEAGQGELWTKADRMVSLFLVKAGAGHELWGSSVVCR